MTVFISTIIPTIGRNTLPRAVKSVLDQQFREAEFEIIVVNDSGNLLPETDWTHMPNLHFLNTNRQERSVARNAGAAIARGKYLHFLDDDDWILPNAFEDFWILTQQTEAGMYYGGYQFIYSHGKIFEECNPNESGNCFIRFMAGEWQPLQASLFDAKIFHSIGGFTSLNLLRGGDEDVDLTRRVSLVSNSAVVERLIAAIRIDREESTTNYSNLQEQSRQSREMILELPNVFLRLRDSAEERRNAAGYWHGRLVWIYLSSVHWNMQKKKFFTLLSRLSSLGFELILSFRHLLSPKFWRGATRPHQANGWMVSEETDYY